MLGEDGGKGAPMACAMVYWNKNIDRFLEVFNEFGAIVDLRPLQGRRIGPRGRQSQLFEVE